MVMVNAPLLVAVVEFTLKFSRSPCAPTPDPAEYNDEGQSESKLVVMPTDNIRAVRSVMKKIFRVLVEKVNLHIPSCRSHRTIIFQ